MSNFRTNISLPTSPHRIHYQHKILLIGSCFAENIGQLMQALKFPIIMNPFGILYNPLSTSNCLQSLIQQQVFRKEDLHFFNEQWLSLQHHGRFSHHEQKTCLDNINQTTQEAAQFIREADVLILTLGTAYVYEWRENGQVVANCHKMPANLFKRYRLAVSTVVERLRHDIEQLRRINPNIRVLFTISPIRHWKDGAIDNQVSKATLVLSVQRLREELEGVDYFPAYEIMMDDLRDYRFYEADMLHPNQVAIQYIWEQFRQRYMDESTQQLMQQIHKIRQAKQHRTRTPKSEAHQLFKTKQLEKIQFLQKQHPYLDFREEIQYFSQ